MACMQPDPGRCWRWSWGEGKPWPHADMGWRCRQVVCRRVVQWGYSPPREAMSREVGDKRNVQPPFPIGPAAWAENSPNQPHLPIPQLPPYYSHHSTHHLLILLASRRSLSPAIQHLPLPVALVELLSAYHCSKQRLRNLNTPRPTPLPSTTRPPPSTIDDTPSARLATCQVRPSATSFSQWWW